MYLVARIELSDGGAHVLGDNAHGFLARHEPVDTWQTRVTGGE